MLADSALPASTHLLKLPTALRRLRRLESTEEIAEAVPALIASLGYGRSLFSWIEVNRWVPRSAYVHGRPAEAAALVAAGSNPKYRSTLDLVESDVQRDRATILVSDPAGNPRVHPELLSATGSTSYVTGPIIVHDRVAALIHVDRPTSGSEVAEHDRLVIEVFLEALGAVLERARHGEALAAALREVESHGAIMRRTLKELEFDPPRDHHAGATERHDEQIWDTLTRRETQVLRLVTDGMTNTQIAGCLFITEETVKSHLKNTLRKLNVSTRTEAGVEFLKHLRTT